MELRCESSRGRVEGRVIRVEIWGAVGRGWLQDSNWLDRSDVILKRKSSSLRVSIRHAS